MRFNHYFQRSEFACRCGCGFDTVDAGLIQVLTLLRTHFNSPVIINSGCRCASHNAEIGGVKNSFHLQGKAADVVVKNVNPPAVFAWLDKQFPNLFGLSLHKTFVHVDVRNQRWRDTRDAVD